MPFVLLACCDTLPRRKHCASNVAAKVDGVGSLVRGETLRARRVHWTALQMGRHISPTRRRTLFFSVVTMVRWAMVKRMSAEVRQETNLSIKERGLRISQIEKLIGERSERGRAQAAGRGRKCRGDEDHSKGAPHQRADSHAARRGRKFGCGQSFAEEWKSWWTFLSGGCGKAPKSRLSAPPRLRSLHK